MLTHLRSRLACLSQSSMLRVGVTLLSLACVATCMARAQDYGIQLLQVPPSNGAPYPLTTTVTGVSSSGLVVGTVHAEYCDNCPYPDPFDAGFTYQNGIYTLVNAGSLSTWVTGINDAGDIVGYYINVHNYTGSFLLENDAFITFLNQGPTSPWNEANGINNIGEVVGTSQNATEGRGFAIANDTNTSISVKGQQITRAQHVNDYGVIVGYAGVCDVECTSWHGFIYDAGKFIPLNYPGATATELTGSNNNGVIVGTYTDSAGAAGSFIYSNEEFKAFSVPGACTTTVTGINNQGVIYGSATIGSNCSDSKFREYGFVATPAPQD